MNRLDPFDRRGQLAFNLGTYFHRHWQIVAVAFAMLVTPLATGWAMPIWSAKHGAMIASTLHKTGYIGLAGVTAAQPKKLAPFRYGTVRRRLTIGQYTLTPGQAIPTITLPQVGMASQIVVRVNGTYTKANASGIATLDGYDAILSRATVKLNNGSAQVCDLSGVGINIVNNNLNPSLPIKRGLITTAGAQTFAYAFVLPISANTREQFTMGLINLQAPQIRCTVDLVANPLSAIFATPADVTLFTAQATVSYEYFEIPDLSKFAMPPLTLVRTIEDAPALIAATGLQTYTLPRLGTMFNYHAVLVLQGVYANVASNLTEIAVRYNKSDTQYDMLIGDDEVYESLTYGNASGGTYLNPHAVSLDLWASGNRPHNGGDMRDAIDTEENTTTEVLITVASTATITGASNLYHVRRVVQRIVA